jgi:hypothetical protein
MKAEFEGAKLLEFYEETLLETAMLPELEDKLGVSAVRLQESQVNSFKSRQKDSDLDNSRRKSKTHDYRCLFCDKMFDKIATKKEHLKSDHADELTCRVCNTRKQSSTATEKCLKDHKFGFDYLCQVCSCPINSPFFFAKLSPCTDLRETFSPQMLSGQTSSDMSLRSGVG